MEKDVLEANYDIRAQQLRNEYADIMEIVKDMKDKNAEARANLDAAGNPISKDIANDVAEKGRGYALKLQGKARDFISHVNANFTTDGTTNPLQKIFAKARAVDGLIDSNYLHEVREQLELYKSYEAIAMALLKDAELALHETLAEKHFNDAMTNLVKQQVIYPLDKVFTNARALGYVNDGMAFYERGSQLLWATKYAEFDSQKSFMQFAADAAKYHTYVIPSVEDVAAMLDRTKKEGDWSEVAKQLGFSKEQAEGVQMITQNVWVLDGTSELYRWFGNNERGPKTVIHSTPWGYADWQNRLNTHKIYTMLAMPLQ